MSTTVSDELIKLGGGEVAYKGLKLISPDNVNSDDFLNDRSNEYHIYANNIEFTITCPNNTYTQYNYNLYNIFNLHNLNKNNAYSSNWNPLFIQINFNKPINICRLEIFPDKITDINNKNIPGFNTYRIYKYYTDMNGRYEDDGELYYTYKNNYIYNDIAQCYQPQIVTFDSSRNLNKVLLFILQPNGSIKKSNPYNKISYVKIYQNISYESYLLYSLVDNNLYQYNDDKSFTNIISYNDFNNKTISEKKELLEKIKSDKEISQLDKDKDIFNKFRIIKNN